jgi:hypothetical protein
VVEGSLASEELEGEDPQAPEIDAPVVVLALQDFGGRVVEGSAVGLPALVADGRPAEITELADILSGGIGTLEITMF